MRAVSMLGAALLCAAAAIGFGRVHPYGDPHLGAGATADRDGLLRDAKMPARAKALLIAKCVDCHSDATRWPAYARIAPGSWLMEHDVMEGREHLNLSRWAELTADRRQLLLAKIVQETRRGDMPPIQYRALHWNAGLSGEDLQVLSMLGKEGGVVEAAGSSRDGGSGDGVGDGERGKALFDKRCTGCHALDADHEGPRLRGVFGRKAGTIPGFNYSAALRGSGVRWSGDSLDKWLSDTDGTIPGSGMEFHVPRAAERADLIAYLKQLK